MLELVRETMGKEIKKKNRKFALKYKEFNILQNNIDDVVQETIQLWKSFYGLTTPKEIMQTPIEVDEDKDDQQVTKVTKEDNEKDIVVEETEMNIDTQAPAKDEQQVEQSVLDTLVQSVSP